MYEFSIAAKYLTPRWRQLSVSIIAIISLLVIAAVVWLIVVFFSVSNGLTNSWIDKLIALTAPIRVTPTEEYYQSYYYLVDEVSADSDYTSKSIGEKLETENSDPYDPNTDPEIPLAWARPDLLADGTLRDPVKEAFAAISQIPGLAAVDYEIGIGTLHLAKIAPQKNATAAPLSQASYVGSLDPHNSKLLDATLASISMADLSNVLKNLPYESAEYIDGSIGPLQKASPDAFRERLQAFFAVVKVTMLETPMQGWQIPSSLLPHKGVWEAIVIEGKPFGQVWIPHTAAKASELQKHLSAIGLQGEKAQLVLAGVDSFLQLRDGSARPAPPALFVPGRLTLDVAIDPTSIPLATDTSELQFNGTFSIQGTQVSGNIPYRGLLIAAATIQASIDASPPWAHSHAGETIQIILPTIPNVGEGILLPKNFRNSGILLGDMGAISYYGMTASSLQLQYLPIYVAGFYDPGIIPIGGKYLIASKEITSQLQALHNWKESGTGVANGINVRFKDYAEAERIKRELQSLFAAAGIARYWKIETFQEYEFTRDIIQQLQSEKRLFTLLAILIIFVACSNIISMLIILVNDKKTEIGILRSMGASASSIAAIFAICGALMGTVGSLIGTIAALVTLKNIQTLVDAISYIQGHEMFNPIFYGETLPTEISGEALIFVTIATGLISVIAGIVPAVKASLLRPSAILKAE